MSDPDDRQKPNPIRHACAPLTDEEKQKILDIARERMVLIDGCLYGLEDDAEPEAFCDCLSRLDICRAVCCSYIFALTQEEVRQGVVAYNPDRPYYIARDPDGFCPHLDRTTYLCSVHDSRPLRCRRFKCSL